MFKNYSVFMIEYKLVKTEMILNNIHYNVKWKKAGHKIFTFGKNYELKISGRKSGPSEWQHLGDYFVYFPNFCQRLL